MTSSDREFEFGGSFSLANQPESDGEWINITAFGDSFLKFTDTQSRRSVVVVRGDSAPAIEGKVLHHTFRRNDNRLECVYLPTAQQL